MKTSVYTLFGDFWICLHAVNSVPCNPSILPIKKYFFVYGPVQMMCWHLEKVFWWFLSEMKSIAHDFWSSLRPFLWHGLYKLQNEDSAYTEESIEEEAKDQADYRIYSDGSGNDENAGVAAVMYKKGQGPKTNSLQLFVGPRSKHNTYEGEAIGAALGLGLAHETPATRNRKVSLYIDNQSIVRALSDTKAKSGQHLLEEVTRIAEDTRCDLMIHWISGHSKVKGNEEADELAKKASTEHISSGATDLPLKLHKPLLMSVSAEKQRYHEELMRECTKSWDTE